MDIDSGVRIGALAAKVTRLRAALANDPDGDLLASFPAGIDLDPSRELDTYRRQVENYTASGRLPAAATVGLESLTLPAAMIDLYRLTDRAQTGDIELLGTFDKGAIMNAEGEVHRGDEPWLRIGLIGNDNFLIHLTTGEVMFTDQYFWRYGEHDTSRLVAPDLLTFFDECMTGTRYREFVTDQELDDEDGWYRFLQDNNFA
ncbi:hypothetical protein ACFXHA_23415 [Nocardia sp. NPDC059240]|uniref:hypothetical protein n=1 Tax=Nocardia sp. NPDC059240 TaxID=3346786 RepID=UPI0036834BB3